MDNVFVYLVDLPVGINELVLPCADGYTIYINEKLDEQRRLIAYEHALEHIHNYDWNLEDVQKIETLRH